VVWGAHSPPGARRALQPPRQALQLGAEAPASASTRASNLGSAVWLCVTECAVAHCPRRDAASLPPWGLTSGGMSRYAGGRGQPQKGMVRRQDAPRAEGSSLGHPSPWG